MDKFIKIKIQLFAFLQIGAYCTKTPKNHVKKNKIQRRLLEIESNLARRLKSKNSNNYIHEYAKMDFKSNPRRQSMVSFMLGFLGDLRKLTIQKVLAAPMAGSYIKNFLKENKNTQIRELLKTSSLLKNTLKDAPVMKSQFNRVLQKYPYINVAQFMKVYKTVAIAPKRRQLNQKRVLSVNIPSFLIGFGVSNQDVNTLLNNPYVKSYARNLIEKNKNMKVREILKLDLVKDLMKRNPHLIKSVRRLVKRRRNWSLGNFLNSAKDSVSKAANTVKDATSKAANTAKNTASKAANTAKKTVSKAANTVKNTASKAAKTVKNTASKAANTAKNTASTVVNKAHETANTIKKGAKKAATEVKKGAKKAITGVKKVAEKAVTEAKKAAKQVVKKVKLLKGKAITFGNHVYNKSKDLVNAIKSHFSNTKEAIQAVLALINPPLREFATELFKPGGLKILIENGSISKILRSKWVTTFIEKFLIKTGWLSWIVKKFVLHKVQLSKDVQDMIKKNIDNKPLLIKAWNLVKSRGTLANLVSPQFMHGINYMTQQIFNKKDNSPVQVSSTSLQELYKQKLDTKKLERKVKIPKAKRITGFFKPRSYK